MSAITALTAASGPSPAAISKAREQAENLEGVFLNTLMKEMFSSLKTDESSFGGGFAEETWRGMQAEQMADAMAKSGGIGLADSLMGDILRLQESSAPASNLPPNGAYR